MLLPVHPQLGAQLAAHGLSVQLGKHMLSTAWRKRVPITDQNHMESNAPFVKDRGPKGGMYNQIGEKSGVGGERYVTNGCMYAALFHLYSSIIAQPARRRAHCRRRRRRRESVPIVLPYAPYHIAGIPPPLLCRPLRATVKSAMTAWGWNLLNCPEQSASPITAHSQSLRPCTHGCRSVVLRTKKEAHISSVRSHKNSVKARVAVRRQKHCT